MSLGDLPTNKPGFDLYADQRGRIIGSCAAILCLTNLFVFLRLLSRKLSRAGYWWDDLFTVVSLVFSNVCCVIILIEIRDGFGRHIYIYDDLTVRAEKVRSWLRAQYVFECFFHTSTSLSKFAILAFYYRIFPIFRFRRICIWVAHISWIYLVVIDFTVIFQCHPIHYAWERFNEKNVQGHCLNVDRFFIASGSVNAVLNFLIFALPIPLLLRLRTTVKQQIVLIALFTLAGFVVLVSIIWIIVLSRLEQQDVTWNYINAGIWSALEPNMAVICACIPSLRPLVSVAGQRFADAPLLVGHKLHPSSTAGSSPTPSRHHHRWWESNTTKSVSQQSPGGAFSQLDEPDDLRPLGHDVSVRAGGVGGVPGDGGEEGIEMPTQGINVRTEVILSTSDRLYYNDRLF